MLGLKAQGEWRIPSLLGRSKREVLGERRSGRKGLNLQGPEKEKRSSKARFGGSREVEFLSLCRGEQGFQLNMDPECVIAETGKKQPIQLETCSHRGPKFDF